MSESLDLILFLSAVFLAAVVVGVVWEWIENFNNRK